MAPGFDLESDLPSMVAMAELWDDFYSVADDTEMNLESKARLRKNLAGEMRLQEQRFGLSPLDRRRLQWEVDRGDEAEVRTQKRKNEAAVKVADDRPDPRELLAG